MNIRSSAITAASALAVVAIGIWFSLDRPAPAPVAEVPKPTVAPAEPALDPSVPVALPAPAIPEDLPPPKPRVVISPEALKDMDNVQFMLRDFRSRLGSNPTGTNAEIMKEIMGQNRYQARLGPPEGQQINAQGELVDRWGSAYFFHQISANEMELRSAGPDKAMYTADDILVK